MLVSCSRSARKRQRAAGPAIRIAGYEVAGADQMLPWPCILMHGVVALGGRLRPVRRPWCWPGAAGGVSCVVAMSEPGVQQAALGQLVDLRCQLLADAEQPEDELRRRDRRIGLEMDGQIGPRRQLAHWLRIVSAGNEPTPGRQAVAALRLIGVILILLGLILGWGAAAAVFYYDGSRPVNAVHVLAVFVGVQLVLMTLWAILALPAAVARYVPGFGLLQEVLGLLSPGRLQALVARFLPQAMRQSLQQALGAGRVHQRLYGRVHKWAVMLWSQGFAVAFNVGALIGCLYRIVFADKWFAWSTTLQIDAAEMHRLTSALALPWSAFLEDAVPSVAMIEATRYFQVQPAPSTEAQLLGAWWPFLVMCMLVYGLAPRVLALALARWRLAKAVHVGIMRTPEVGRLLARLSRSLVETRAEQPEAEVGATDRGAPAQADIGVMPGGPTINWAGVDLDDEAAAQLVGGGAAAVSEPVLHAGGSLAQDGQVIERIARSGADRPVTVLVKSWEPPMLDFVDFVEDLRKAVGDGRPITVLPIGVDPAGGSAAPTAADVASWRGKLQAVGDPWLSVRAPATEAS